MNRLDYKSSRLLGFKEWRNGRFLPNFNQEQLQQRMVFTSHENSPFRSQDLFFLLRNSNNLPTANKVKKELVETIKLLRSKSKEQKARLLNNMVFPPYSTVAHGTLRNGKRKKSAIFSETPQQHIDTKLSVTSHFRGVSWCSSSRTLRKHLYTHIG
ncbi:hypothetical protein P879_06936 [Paragonimus westermani]|uniref:Uncharacterized protein n=1 Tax=Paragonimus westermani TaxID=34504 RepID=A0A8T0DJ59_9TREM|nr:hypothetical protein P879_06936 [Paragonimus westermani]